VERGRLVIKIDRRFAIAAGSLLALIVAGSAHWKL
jgi:hypothetical protein